MAKKKKWRVPEAKPGQLKARYGRASKGDLPEICYAWGKGTESSDGRILSKALEEIPVYQGRSLVDELTERGYDITTLRFSIERLPEKPSTEKAP